MYLSLKADTSVKLITQTSCEGVSIRGTFFVSIGFMDWAPAGLGMQGRKWPLSEGALGGSGAELGGRAQRALKAKIYTARKDI